MTTFIRLVDINGEVNKKKGFFSDNNKYRATITEFRNISGCIFAYWLSEKFIALFSRKRIGDFGVARQGLATSNNERFIRFWYEVKLSKINFECKSLKETFSKTEKWFPYIKGGSFRRWYPNIKYIVNYLNNGAEIKKSVMSKYTYLKSPDFVVKNTNTYFRQGITWSDVATNDFSARFVPDGYIYADAGPMYFLNNKNKSLLVLGYMNSKVFQRFAALICQGLHYSTGQIPQIPIIDLDDFPQEISEISKENIYLTKQYWDSRETSLGFKRSPLI
jgi:hypothetical protein